MKHKKLEKLCDALKLTKEEFPLTYICQSSRYCDYKTSVNLKDVCVRYMHLIVKIERGR